MKVLSALLLALVASVAQAQTSSEYTQAVAKELKPVFTNILCGSTTATVQVKAGVVRITKYSSSFEFDNEVVRAARVALDKSMTQWVEFPVTLELGTCTGELILGEQL